MALVVISPQSVAHGRHMGTGRIDQKKVFCTSMWQREELFSDGVSYFERILKDLERAQTSVTVECYIFRLDAFGKKVASALLKAAERGLKVRVLVDAIGSLGVTGPLQEFFRNSSVELGIYHPLSIRNLNKRNHRKVWILDGTSAFVSSLNISSEYASSILSPDQGWKDYGLRVEGPEISLLKESFERAWLNRNGFLPARFRRVPRLLRGPKRSNLVHSNDTFFRRRRNFAQLISRIKKAKDHIWIANCYFAPPPRFIRQLSRAARRGVQVRLLIPQRSDVFFMGWLAWTYYEKLLKAGVSIFEYKPTVFHGKVMIIDQFAMVGSSNLNYRSIFHDLEVDISVSQDLNREALRTSLVHDFALCHRVLLQEINHVPWYRRILANILLTFKYWF